MTLNKKTISLIALIMVVGSAGMTYAATSYFGEDCSIYGPETVPSKACYDLNYLSVLVHNLTTQNAEQAIQIANVTDRLAVLEAIVNPEPEPEPDPVPTELTIEVKPTSILAGENFTASGEVPYVEGFDVVDLQILSPDNSTFVYISTPLVELDGSYSDVIITGSPDWSVSGNYTVTVLYNAESVEALLDYITP